jgi:hypothetical protein
MHFEYIKTETTPEKLAGTLYALEAAGWEIVSLEIFNDDVIFVSMKRLIAVDISQNPE